MKLCEECFLTGGGAALQWGGAVNAEIGLLNLPAAPYCHLHIPPNPSLVIQKSIVAKK
jgi:hypothetical protein